MLNQTIALPRRETAKAAIFDFLILAALYFLPTISHLLAFPVYLFEPMRIGIVLVLAYTSKRNAYLLALTLPVFSYIVAAHPVFVKALLIGVEMTLNVWLFYALTRRINNTFAAMAISILASKIVYYAAKYVLISTGLLVSELVSTPFIYQAVVLLLSSVMIYFLAKSNREA